MWCFAKVNNRLAEIYFEKKKEQAWIKADTAKFKFVYWNRRYKNTDPNDPELN